MSNASPTSCRLQLVVITIQWYVRRIMPAKSWSMAPRHVRLVQPLEQIAIM